MAKKTATKSQDDLLLDKIKCPHCGELIPISETLQHQLTERMRLEFEEKLKEDKLKIEQETRKKAKADVSVEIKDLLEQVKEKDEKLEEAQKAELEFRKKKRELDNKEKNLDLEVSKRIDKEKSAIREEAAKEVSEEYRLKDEEREKKLRDALKANEEMKRKLEQGSQQTQGEVLELELEEILKSKFPHDDIEPVPTGMKGSDILQKVCSPSGQLCGIVAWEAKNTKTWSDGWISKLKEDQRETNADISILVTMALPKDISTFGLKNGIWVTNYDSLLGLATAIRMNLIQVAVTKQSAVGKNEKMELLYNYLTSPAFKHKVEAIVEAFKEMQEDVSEEKRIFAKRWAKREKQIERVILSTSGMYGDMQGLIGKQMQSIPALELKEDKKDRNE